MNILNQCPSDIVEKIKYKIRNNNVDCNDYRSIIKSPQKMKLIKCQNFFSTLKTREEKQCSKAFNAKYKRIFKDFECKTPIANSE